MRHVALCLILLAASTAAAPAQTPAAPGATAQVLMLSDFHFDPFRSASPAQLKLLLKADPDEWAQILDNPIVLASKDRSGCDGTRSDTDYSLLRSSLAEEQKNLPSPPLFLTVSGDLTTHNFDCKYRQLVASNDPAGLSDFAARTAEFIALELHQAFPKSPVYLALGNNDSSCTDYAETEAAPGKPNLYLDGVAKVFASVALDSANARSILATFSTRGDYTVLLPKPFADTELIVLQDLFEYSHYKGACKGATNPDDAAAAQIAWLKARLADPSVKHVWMLAHIPPGADPYNTIAVNGGCPAYQTLGTNDFVNLLAASSKVDLVLYGHTHMDEMRLISDSSGTGKVPGRLNPSITPWNNLPSFTVATVDPARALLVDFTVYRAPNKAGSGDWTYRYTYSSAYGEPDYSAASLQALTAVFKTDTSPNGPVANYQKYYQSTPAKTNWAAYLCTITSATPGEYNACYCANSTRAR